MTSLNSDTTLIALLADVQTQKTSYITLKINNASQIDIDLQKVICDTANNTLMTHMITNYEPLIDLLMWFKELC